MKKIAVLQDLSGLGRCSLTAALPVISAMGVQACPLPTAILSNQTGYSSYYCDDYTDKIQYFSREWKKISVELDGIYTGFLSGEHQAEQILKFVNDFRMDFTKVIVDPVMGDGGKKYAFFTQHLLEQMKMEHQAEQILKFVNDFRMDFTKVIVDPVMGDGGKKYAFFTQHLLEQMKMLVSEADMITPNITEALILTGDDLEQSYQTLNRLSVEPQVYKKEVERIGKKLKEQFDLEAIAITGNHYCDHRGKELVGNLILQGEEMNWIESEKIGGSYSGTGDLFASALSAGFVKGESLSRCAQKVVTMIGFAIRDAVESGSDRNEGVEFEKYLSYLWEKGQ